MNDVLTSKLKMFINTSDVCKQHQQAWSGIVAFNNSFNFFTAKIAKINELNTQLQNSSKTTTEQKNFLKKTMADKTMVIVGSLKAYASVNKDISLQEVSNITAGKIMASKDVDADDVCLNVIEKAKSILPGLADFATTQTEIDVAVTAINAYTDMVGKPKTAILNNKSYNEQINALFKEANAHLSGELDAMMNHFKTTNEVFYNAYTAARKVPSPVNKKEEEPTEPKPEGTEKK
jgi:hypothetical protein